MPCRAPAVHRAVARMDPQLRAVLGDARPLQYSAKPDPAADLPAHVRAASAVRRLGSRLVIVQDDVNAFAMLDPATGRVEPLLLPAGPGGARQFDDTRGTKKLKLDLEACVLLPDGRLVAFGSGSSRLRQRVAVMGLDATDVSLIEASSLYDELHRQVEPRGAQLNIEAAVVRGDWLRLFQRGNDKTRGVALNAVLDVALAEFIDWLDGVAIAAAGPRPGNACRVRRVLEVDLDELAGIPFGFTDAAVTPDGRTAFIACAEDSPDARSDGPVLGCRFGWLDPTDEFVVTTTNVTRGDGTAVDAKLEGLEARTPSRPRQPVVFDVVADMDRPGEAATHAELQVIG
jgi:Family of unknown function (DUF6929)